MANTVGVVSCLRVGDDFAFVTINETAGGSETLIVWFAPRNTTAYQRVLQNTWLSLLKESLTSGATVRVAHPDDGAFILSVQLNAVP